MSYQKVKLADGRTKRINIKSIQRGCQPADIDRDFASEEPRMEINEAMFREKSVPITYQRLKPAQSVSIFSKLDPDISNAAQARKYLWGLKGDELVRAMNIVFDYISKTEEVREELFYEFIRHAFPLLNIENRNNFILLIPVLIYRRIKNIEEAYEQEDKHDKNLKAIFREEIDKLLESLERQKNGLRHFKANTSLKDRAKALVMETCDIEEMSVDDTMRLIDGMNTEEIYEMINSVEVPKLHAYFIVDFMTSDKYLDTVGVYAITESKQASIPGVNMPLSMESIIMLNRMIEGAFEIE